jgi:hypothetical protein
MAAVAGRVASLGAGCWSSASCAGSSAIVRSRSWSNDAVRRHRPTGASVRRAARVRVFDPLLSTMCCVRSGRNVWVGSVAVARLEGRDAVKHGCPRNARGRRTGPPGRRRDRTATEIDEATITETASVRAGRRDRITLALLTAGDRQFDTGFGEPEGALTRSRSSGSCGCCQHVRRHAVARDRGLRGRASRVVRRCRPVHRAPRPRPTSSRVRRSGASSLRQRSRPCRRPDFAAVSVEPVRSGISCSSVARVLVIALRTMLAIRSPRRCWCRCRPGDISRSRDRGSGRVGARPPRRRRTLAACSVRRGCRRIGRGRLLGLPPRGSSRSARSMRPNPSRARASTRSRSSGVHWRSGPPPSRSSPPARGRPAQVSGCRAGVIARGCRGACRDAVAGPSRARRSHCRRAGSLLSAAR